MRRHGLLFPVTAAGVLAVAAILRVWGMGQGYPDLYGHVDEVGVAASIWNFFRSGTLRPTEFNYPDLYSYLVAAAVWCTAWLGAGGLDDTGDALILLSFADPGWAALVGRVLSAVASTASAAVVYRLGCEAFGRRVGILAAAFFAVSASATQQAHRALPDSTMALFATLCVLYSWRLYRTGSWRHYAIAGTFAGLVVSTKYNGAFVSFALVAAHVLRHVHAAPSPSSSSVAKGPAPLTSIASMVRVVADRKLWMAVGLSVVALLATTPYLILASHQYLSLIRYQTSSLAFSFAETHPWTWIPLAYISEERVLGVLMLGGLGMALKRRHPVDWMLLAGWVPSFIYMGTWTRESLHYLLQFHAVLALVAARLVLAIGESGRAGWRRHARAVAVALIVVVLGTNGIRIVGSDLELTSTDTRALAARWIEQNVPAGSTIAMTWLPYCPRLDMVSARAGIPKYLHGRHEIRQALAERWLTRPAYRFVNLEGWLKQPVVPEAYAEHVDLADPETRRVFRRRWRGVQRLRRDGVQWVVLPEAVYQRYLNAAVPPAHTAAHFRYESNRSYFEHLLAPAGGLELEAQFPVESSPVSSRGGRISIFRVP